MECVIYVKIFERYHDAIYIIERIKLEDLCSGGEENAMPELKINIRTEILDWIIENASFDEFRHEFKEDIALWKSGAKSPTFNQLERFSKSTNIPFGYFFLTNPPTEKIGLLEYRTVDSLKLEHPSRNLVDTIYEMESIQEWMKEYLISTEFEELSYVGSLREVNDVARIAHLIRIELQIDEKWFLSSSDSWDSFKLLRNRLENIGVLVMMSGIVGANTHRSLDISEFRAFTLIDKYAPLIFINANDSYSGRLFSLIHEMVHIWIGENSLYNVNQQHINNINKIEVLCNAVTAEILVPLNQFQSVWHQFTSGDLDRAILEISKYFRCGITIIARRALDCGFISKETYTSISQSATSRFIDRMNNPGSGGNYYQTLKTRIDNRLISALNESVFEGKTSFSKAYRLTNTNRKTFSELVRMTTGSSL